MQLKTNWLRVADSSVAKKDPAAVSKVKLPCGCEYQDKGWLLTRVSECYYHKRRRTPKKPYKPKAECVRP